MSIIALQLQILGCHGAKTKETFQGMTAISSILGKSDLRLKAIFKFEKLIAVRTLIVVHKLIAVKLQFV